MIIGITGNKQSGKDTSANYFIKKHNFIKLSFAQPLKEICKVLFDFNEEQVNGSKKEEIDEFWKVTPRSIMQFLGTEIFRNEISKIIPNIKENFWTKIMEQKILNNNNKHIVIPDVRFSNEVDLIRKFNGIIIQIHRNTGIIDFHSSETELNKIIPDYIIENNDTIDELYKKLKYIIV